MITNVIKYYRGPTANGKCKIFSNILFCMLSILMMNCRTNFLNTLYIAAGQGQANKNIKVRSFKSNEHIRKKVDGPYFEVLAKKASSVTL